MVRDRSCAPRVGGALGESRDAGQNLVGSRGPDERLRILLMRIDEGLNRRFELRHTAKDAAAKLCGQQSEPAFDETQPRGVRRGEVHVETPTFGEPVPDQRRFMDPVPVFTIGKRTTGGCPLFTTSVF